MCIRDRDSFNNLSVQLEAIKDRAVIGVHPYAALTVGEKGESLSDMETVATFVIGFSDDGKGVQSKDIMRQAMLTAKKLGKVIAAHCEDESLLNGGYIPVSYTHILCLFLFLIIL